MAALDPTKPALREDVDDATPPFATLKIVRILGDDLDEEEDDEDYEDIDSDDESDDDMGEVNGGPSDPKKAKLSKKQALLEALAADEEDSDEEMDDSEDGDDEEEAQRVLAKLKEAVRLDKGKGKAIDEDEDSDDESDEALEEDEHVICTLNLTSHPQQPLDFTVSENEHVFFKVIGTHAVSLTGNYVLPPLDPADQDLEPDSDEELDELDGLDDLIGDGESDSEIDDLDDLEDPRITELDEEEAPKLIKGTDKAVKGKNKRPADDSDDDEPALDDMISKSLTVEAKTEAPTTNGETKKLTKAEKKRLKKLKNNEGEAADAPAAAAATEAKPETNGANKKVQFAKNLEQGPTPSPAAKPAAASAGTTRTVQGVEIDDRKLGTGPAAKKGSSLSMRYIGKLKSNSKVFDSNKSGKPFTFKLGSGEVIKGWDVGLEGLQVGGERRITIPANLAYGKKGAPPDIPANATLVFDVKCVGVK
jgi:FK506-binding nuclear protein